MIKEKKLTLAGAKYIKINRLSLTDIKHISKKNIGISDERKEQMREYYQRNKEVIKDRAKRHYQKRKKKTEQSTDHRIFSAYDFKYVKECKENEVEILKHRVLKIEKSAAIARLKSLMWLYKKAA